MSPAPHMKGQPQMGPRWLPGGVRPYLPSPYPDELGYSLVARALRRWGGGWARSDNELLFQRDRLTATTDLTAMLDLALTGSAADIGPLCESLTWRHTLIPYYTANRSTPLRGRIVQRIAVRGAAGFHTRLGICTTPIKVPQHLRVCPQCARADMERFGEPYWHRVHQLPGVLACPVHGTAVYTTDVPTRPVGRHEFLPLDLRLLAEAAPEPLDKTMQPQAWVLARHLGQLLDYPLDAPPVLDERLLNRDLSESGYLKNRGSLERLEHDLRAHFQSGFLEQIDQSVRVDEPIQWVLGLRHNPRSALHPVRHTLLRLLLNSSVRKPPIAPFGEGPWPCLNWASDHYGQAVIKTLETFRDRNYPGRTLARFQCLSCGMRFTRYHGQADPTRPYRVLKFGLVFEAQARMLKAKGYRVRAIARLLEVDPKTVKRLVGDSASPSKASPMGDTQTAQDQTAWLKLVSCHPNEGVTALRRREPALYSRLYRRARQWLHEHSPRCSEPRLSATKVDWQARDAQLCLRVERQARALREERPLRRVTVNAIGGRLGCRALLQKKIHLLPRTCACLARHCETTHAYRVRRLRDVVDRYPPGTPPWRILRMAAIRSEHVTDALLADAGLESWLDYVEDARLHGDPDGA